MLLPKKAPKMQQMSVETGPSKEYDESYLNSLIDKAKDSWADVQDADEWLRDLRGADY